MLVLIALAHAAEPDLTGRYALAEPPEALARIHATAVEEALAQLPWAFRPIARRRLEPAVRSCGVLELELSAEAFRSVCDDRPPFRQDRGASDGTVTDDGKTYAVRLQVGDDALQVRFSGEDGGQEVRYTPQDDGSLLVTKQIFSAHLSDPVSWTVRYR